MIKAIFFDFDGVLTIDKTGSASVIRYLSQQTGLDADVIQHCYYRYNKRLLLGELTHAAMWDDFCRDMEQPLPYQLLLDAFQHTALDNDMIAYARQLKAQYKIGLITDNKCDRIDTILNHFQLTDCFDVVAVSAALHSGKDAEEIFLYALKQLDIQADEAIFIDNTAKNLLVPASMGFSTLLFDDEKRDIEAFKAQLSSLLGNE